MANYNAIKYDGFSKGSTTLLSTVTASRSATIDFTSGIDSTYKEYLFIYNNIHPATDSTIFQVNFRDGSTDFDATKTTTYFYSYIAEDNTETGVVYYATGDLAQSTAAAPLSYSVGNGNDESVSGYLHLFNPSSTTYVKHFISVNNVYHKSNFTQNRYVAGYCNVTAAIDGAQFSMSSGNIDAGTIQLIGIT